MQKSFKLFKHIDESIEGAHQNKILKKCPLRKILVRPFVHYYPFWAPARRTFVRAPPRSRRNGTSNPDWLFTRLNALLTLKNENTYGYRLIYLVYRQRQPKTKFICCEAQVNWIILFTCFGLDITWVFTSHLHQSFHNFLNSVKSCLVQLKVMMLWYGKILFFVFYLIQ